MIATDQTTCISLCDRLVYQKKELQNHYIYTNHNQHIAYFACIIIIFILIQVDDSDRDRYRYTYLPTLPKGTLRANNCTYNQMTLRQSIYQIIRKRRFVKFQLNDVI